LNCQKYKNSTGKVVYDFLKIHLQIFAVLRG
jgi:hypothetical protein